MRKLDKRISILLYELAVFISSAFLVIWMPKFSIALAICCCFTLVSWTVYLYGVLTLTDAKKKNFVYLIPIARISRLYALIATVVSVIFLLFYPDVRIIAVVHSILLFAVITRLSLINVARDYAGTVQSATKQKVTYQKNLLIQIERISSSVQILKGEFSEDIMTKVDQIKDLIRYGDPMSHDSLQLLEQQIISNVDQLQEKIDCKGIDEEDNTAELLALTVVIKKQLEERNDRIKSLKRA